MKSLQNLKKASFVTLSSLVLVLGLAAAPQAFAKESKGDNRGENRQSREERRNREDRGDRREGNREDRKDRSGDNETSGDMDWDNSN
jgi:hypothetical protein